MNRRPLIALAAMASLGVLLLGGCGDEDPPSTTVAATTTTTAPQAKAPMPAELQAIYDQLTADGVEVKPKATGAAVNELSVDGGVTVTLWPNEKKRDSYLRILERVRDEHAPNDVLFDSEGLVVVWLNVDGNPTSGERELYEQALAAARG